MPGWVQNVNNRHCTEQAVKLSRNIYDKILKAFEFREVGESAIQWHDDIFLTKKLHVKDLKYWHEGTLEDAIEKNQGSYKQYIVNTGLQITGAAKYFDIHTPIIYEKEIFRSLKKYDWQNKNLLVKSLYCHEAKVEGVELKDCKIFQPYEKSEIEKKIAGKLFFSTGPQGLSPAMGEIFEGIYPEPSKYEK